MRPLDDSPIATFRRRFLADIERLFVEVLALAWEAGMLKLERPRLDGAILLLAGQNP
jgi:hypothetical protein